MLCESASQAAARLERQGAADQSSKKRYKLRSIAAVAPQIK